MGKLYTYPDNFRADKIKAVAAISGYKLEVQLVVAQAYNYAG